MKRLLFLCLVSLSCCGNTQKNSDVKVADYYQLLQSSSPSVTSIEGIQKKINEAFVQSFITQKNDALIELAKNLEQLYREKNQNLILYWRSYLQFYTSIYFLKANDKKKAEKEIDRGIDWLEGMPNKNSEDYALLSMLQGYALQFKGLKVMFLAGEVKRNASQAIALDSTNLRGYYVYASNDFYTPAKYGGGHEVEKYLMKALSLPAQKVANTYLPSWGIQEAYELIIKHYIAKEQWEQAKNYYKEAATEFPENYQITQLASKLVGK
jgi:hypothetical protein